MRAEGTIRRLAARTAINVTMPDTWAVEASFLIEGHEVRAYFWGANDFSAYIKEVDGVAVVSDTFVCMELIDAGLPIERMLSGSLLASVLQQAIVYPYLGEWA